MQGSDAPGVIAPPPLIFGGIFAAAAGASHFTPIPALPAAVRRIGVPCIAVAIANAGAAVVAMRRAGTNIDPYKPTIAIVQTGPFRFSRNPLYTSMVLLYAGASLMMRSAVPLLVLPGVIALMNRGVISREERYLEDKFGDRYLAYKMRVRRWI